VQVRGTQQLSPDLIRSTAGVDGKSVFRLDLSGKHGNTIHIPHLTLQVARRRGHLFLLQLAKFLLQSA